MPQERAKEYYAVTWPAEEALATVNKAALAEDLRVDRLTAYGWIKAGTTPLAFYYAVVARCFPDRAAEFEAKAIVKKIRVPFRLPASLVEESLPYRRLRGGQRLVMEDGGLFTIPEAPPLPEAPEPDPVASPLDAEPEPQLTEEYRVRKGVHLTVVQRPKNLAVVEVLMTLAEEMRIQRNAAQQKLLLAETRLQQMQAIVKAQSERIAVLEGNERANLELLQELEQKVTTRFVVLDAPPEAVAAVKRELATRTPALVRELENLPKGLGISH